MNPADTEKQSHDNPRSSMAPPYVDEDLEAALVKQGLAAAEDETRDAVADAYESSARRSDEVEETLGDIDYESGEDTEVSPEMAAMHEEFIPPDDGEYEEE